VVALDGWHKASPFSNTSAYLQIFIRHNRIVDFLLTVYYTDSY
jgi:hypothetical protein